MGATNESSWKHITIPKNPKDWAFDVANVPCACNLDDSNRTDKPKGCYANYLVTNESSTHGICHMPPGGYLPYHTHEASELYLPLKGSCTLFIDGHIKTITGSSREAIYIPSNCPHGLRNDSNEPYEFLYLYYGKNGEKADTTSVFQDFVQKKKSDN